MNDRTSRSRDSVVPREATQDLQRARIVVDRTSGAEDEEQDAAAQAKGSELRAKEAGRIVVATYWDEDVAGDSSWDERPRLQKAIAHALRADAVLHTRSPSRLWRGRPAQGVVLIETLPNLEILGKPHWDRRDGRWLRDDDGDEVMRFIDLWQAWTTKRNIRVDTQRVMDEIKKGDRRTRSGKRPGRPVVEIDPEHLDEARGVWAREGAAAAHRRVLELRGFDAAKDPKTKAKRFVSKSALGRALGFYSVQNGAPSKTMSEPPSESSVRDGPDVDGRGNP